MEWTVVGVIVTLVGLALAVGGLPHEAVNVYFNWARKE